MTALSRERILALFDELNARLAERDVTGELYVVGGAVLCLVHRARAATRDVDALFEPKGVMRQLAAEIAVDLGVPEGWLNDAVKGFVGESQSYDPFLELSHLRVMTASPEYLLAMKAVAMRIGAEFHDVADVRFLLRYLGVQSYEQALSIVQKYYSAERIPQKTLYALEEIVETMEE